MKMELIEGSETSAIRTQTPGNYPKENVLHIEHSESLKIKKPFGNLLPADMHEPTFIHGGFSDYRKYRYWNPVTKGVDFDGMIQDLRLAPANSVVILQACAHNPTGCDLTKEQWIKVADVVQVRRRSLCSETLVVFLYVRCVLRRSLCS